MNKEVKEYLIKHIEPSVIALLILNDLGKLIDPKGGNTFENFEPKEGIVKKIVGNKAQFSPEFLRELISIFPAGSGCSEEDLLSRLRSWLNKTSLQNITESHILEAAKFHMNKYDPPYHGQLLYFIYKMDGSIYKSRLDAALGEIILVEESYSGIELEDTDEPSTFEL